MSSYTRPAPSPILTRRHLAVAWTIAIVGVMLIVVLAHKTVCTPVDVSDTSGVSDARVAQYLSDGYTGRINDGGEYLYAEGC